MINHFDLFGQSVFIRTVTHYYTGRVTNTSESVIMLEDAAWIADTGRYHIALRDGILNEVEPIPSWVIINREAIVDIVPWNHPLPREAK